VCVCVCVCVCVIFNWTPYYWLLRIARVSFPCSRDTVGAVVCHGSCSMAGTKMRWRLSWTPCQSPQYCTCGQPACSVTAGQTWWPRSCWLKRSERRPPSQERFSRLSSLDGIATSPIIRLLPPHWRVMGEPCRWCTTRSHATVKAGQQTARRAADVWLSGWPVSTWGPQVCN
jgi:hypothetical protein